jgi:NHLM bacteriocin system ABC transporter ATP-binding protein
MSRSSPQSIAGLRSRLGGLVENVPVEGDRPLLLTDPSCAYITLSEQHQLFCVDYRNGTGFGRREHVAICGPGQLLIGLEPPPGEGAVALLLSGVTGSVVWRVPAAALFRQLEDEEGRAILEGLFNEWIELLIATLPSAPVPTRCVALAPGDVHDHDATAPIRSNRGVVWIAPPKGPERYIGIELGGKTAGQPWPLTEQAWAEAAGERLRVRSTRELLLDRRDASFAEGFYAFVVASVGERRRSLAGARLEQDRTSSAAEAVFVSDALRKLAAVGSAQGVTQDAGGADAFTKAVLKIAAFLRIDPAPRLVAPRRPALPAMQAALSRITGARTRGVLLEKGWAKGDLGALLGFRIEDEEVLHPVALLPAGGGYDLHDPRSGDRIRVNEAISNTLHPQAYQFYPGFPDRPVGPVDILRYSTRRTRRDILFVGIVGMLTGSVSMLIPLLTGTVFDRIIPGAERGLLWELSVVLVAVYGGLALFDLARGFSIVRAQTLMDATLEASVWDRLLSLPLPFFRHYSAGDLASRAAGIGGIREVLAGATISVLLSGLFSIWNFGLLFAIDTKLALAATGLAAIAGLVAMFAAYAALARQGRVMTLDGKIGGLLLQIISGIAKLRVTASENRAFSVWSKLFVQRRDADLQAEKVNVRIAVFQSSFPLLCSIVLFFLLAQSPATQTLSTGRFLAFTSSFGLFMAAMLDVIETGLKSLSIIPMYQRAKPILTHSAEPRGRVGVRTEIKGAIEISHVSFRYHADSPLILDDVSFRIEGEEFVAIVGSSGSGKSTLLRILLGFETPSAGGVFYDGQALSQLDVRSVRQQMGVVMQNSQVMAGDIFTNIVGNTGLTIDEAWEAARRAGFAKDIEAMPMGMHTVISQGAGTLSGGQRQRLLIARALASTPKILFFDEATSALDNVTQAAVSESIEGLRVTRVVIAHRLSTIQHADKIVVLERGRIVQMGRFNELSTVPGVFRELAKRQRVD